MQFQKTIQQIYEHMEDDVSKQIFSNRLLYSLTGDFRYMLRVIEMTGLKAAFDKKVEECRKVQESLVFYGAGNDLVIFHGLYPEFPIREICDRNFAIQKNGWNGIRVISPEELWEKKGEFHVAICTGAFHSEIKKLLVEHGIAENKIINLGEVSAHYYNMQYFDADVFAGREETGFVDGGCYNGNTSLLFANYCSNRYQRIYAFEPDAQNYLRCKQVAESGKIANMSVYERGLWDCGTELSFQEDGSQGSRIDGSGSHTVTVRTASIDETVGDNPVSFIKLDVEGSERKALEGAKETIRKNHPRLAVCIYHKPEDMWEIPEYILSLSEDYRFYIRHYQLSRNETVLYAF
jgi:FkbM family methyltransferase